MNWEDLEKHFSRARLGRYLAARGGDTSKAANDYEKNVLLSEAMMPVLNTLEVALRNGIDARLSGLYGRRDWWDTWINDPNFSWQSKEISKVKIKLKHRRELQTPDKVLAELTFGFWISLFNAQFQTLLWKDLRLVFSYCPKQNRKRHTISTALNQIRDLRNRVFHHEPLLWLAPSLVNQHMTALTVIKWIDPKLEQWVTRYDRLSQQWARPEQGRLK